MTEGYKRGCTRNGCVCEVPPKACDDFEGHSWDDDCARCGWSEEKHHYDFGQPEPVIMPISRRIDAYSEQRIYQALIQESRLHPEAIRLSEATLGRLAEAANESLKAWQE